MNRSTLKTRGVISVTGQGAGDFLNRLLTNNAPVEYGVTVYALLLNPRGKVLYDFFIQKSEDGRFLLDVPSDYMEEILAKLDMYKLNLSLTIAIEDLNVTVSDYHDNYSLLDPRLSGCYRTLERRTHDTNTEWYDALRIQSIVPEHTIDFKPGELFPTHMSMHKFGAIDYNKGCYVGQEVIARMTHRGRITKGLYLVELEDGVEKLNCRDIRYEGIIIGRLLSCHKNFGIAILPIEESDKITQNSASVSETRLRVAKCL